LKFPGLWIYLLLSLLIDGPVLCLISEFWQECVGSYGCQWTSLWLLLSLSLCPGSILGLFVCPGSYDESWILVPICYLAMGILLDIPGTGYIFPTSPYSFILVSTQYSRCSCVPIQWNLVLSSTGVNGNKNLVPQWEYWSISVERTLHFDMLIILSKLTKKPTKSKWLSSRGDRSITC
jgi:hypothetical protein